MTEIIHMQLAKIKPRITAAPAATPLMITSCRATSQCHHRGSGGPVHWSYLDFASFTKRSCRHFSSDSSWKQGCWPVPLLLAGQLQIVSASPAGSFWFWTCTLSSLLILVISIHVLRNWKGSRPSVQISCWKMRKLGRLGDCLGP